MREQRASDLGSRQGQCQLLGCSGIVAPFGHKPEKRQTDLGAGARTWRGRFLAGCVDGCLRKRLVVSSAPPGEKEAISSLNPSLGLIFASYLGTCQLIVWLQSLLTVCK